MARLYHGGKELIYTNYHAVLDPRKLVMECVRYINDTTTEKHKAEKIKSYCKRTGLAVKNGYPALTNDLQKWGGDSQIYNIYIDTSATSPFSGGIQLQNYNSHYGFTFEEGQDKQEHQPQKGQENGQIRLDRIDLHNALYQCQLLNTYLHGDEYLHYQPLYGLILNLINIQGGQQLIEQGLSYVAPERADRLRSAAEYARRMGYYPAKCDNISCPYLNNCDHRGNIINTINNRRGNIMDIQPQPTISLQDAEQQLQQAYQQAISAEGNNIHIIRAATGLGKTQLYLKEENVIIAVPTHKLKDEVAERCRAQGNDVLTSPEIPQSFPEADKQPLELYYKVGLYKKAAKHIGKMVKEGNVEAKEYLEQIQKIKNTARTIVTTHEKLLQLNDISHGTVVIDEDIFKSLLKIDLCSLDVYTFYRFS
jgi:hypothetical protein